jgi:hypothetical protein
LIIARFSYYIDRALPIDPSIANSKNGGFHRSIILSIFYSAVYKGNGKSVGTPSLNHVYIMIGDNSSPMVFFSLSTGIPIAGNPYISYQIEETGIERFRKSERGRPSQETKYTKTVETRYQISCKPMTDAIEKYSRSDGTFPLITNCIDDEVCEILVRYKHQPMLEKRHEQLKTQYNVTPVLFKNAERIEAFLFMYFIAMTIQALIERDIRMNMEKRGIASLPIYPEGRECSSPTAYRILSLFDNIMLNHIIINGREIKRIHTDLTEVQK